MAPTMMRRRVLSYGLDAPVPCTIVTPKNERKSHAVRGQRLSLMLSRKRRALFSVLTSFMACLCLYLLSRAFPLFFSSDDDWQAHASFYTTTTQIEKVLQESSIAVNDIFVVFVTSSNGDQSYVQMGRSPQSTYDAFQQAMSLHQQVFIASENSRPIWIKVDVVDRLETIDGFDFSQSFEAQVGGQRWFYGLALDWEDGWAFLPEEVIANNMIDGKRDLVRWDNILAYVLEKQRLEQKNIFGWRPLLENRNVEDSSLKSGLHLFKTKSYFIDLTASEANLAPVYHGHRLFDKAEVSPTLLMKASHAAGDYLIRSIKPNGKMVYIYNPRTDEESDSYNLTRHAGTLYAMACLLHQTKDPVLHDSIRLSLNWLLKENLKKCRLPYLSGKDTAIRRCIVEKTPDERGVAKLGSNALTLLAISEFVAASYQYEDDSNSSSNNSRKSEHEYYVEVARDLADYILSAQHTDGSFVQKIQHYPNFALDEDFFVRYYQGEATFALSRFYHVSGSVGLEQKQEWLDVAEAAAQFIIDENWNVPDDEFVDDHWLMYGLAELYRCDPRRLNPRFVDFAMRTVRLVAASQYKDDQKQINSHLDSLDWVGIHHESSSATSTATKSEGLCAVYDIAMEHHRQEEASLIIDTITDSVRYQLKSQYGPELAMYMRDPRRIVGGVRKGIDSLLLRNDYTQHNLSSFLCLARVIQKRTDQL